jgi:hypothetical protein
MWLCIADYFASNKCSNVINIHLVLTDHLKLLPSKDKEISKEHANSAFTTSCAPHTTINIYRYEEWFKVFIHETMHNLGLDFSAMNTNLPNTYIKKTYPLFHIKDLRIYESYCEIWAELINIVFYVFFTSTKKIFEKIVKCVLIETEWSLLQCVKVLNFYGLTYKEMYEVTADNKRHKYKETDTHIMSYYVIKSLLFFKIKEFVIWCYNNNDNILDFKKSESNIISFCNFIRTHHNDKDFLLGLKKYEEFFKEYDDQSDLTMFFIKNTLRMSLLEF